MYPYQCGQRIVSLNTSIIHLYDTCLHALTLRSYLCSEMKAQKVRDSLGKRGNIQVRRELTKTRERKRLSRKGGVKRK